MPKKIADRRDWKFNPGTGKYEYKGGSWTPPHGYVNNPNQPQPDGWEAYYFHESKEERPAKVGRHNIRSVEKMLQFFALIGCIAFLLVAYAHKSKKADQAQEVTEIVIE